MKRFKTAELIGSLQEDVRSILLGAEQLATVDAGTLNQPPAPGAWSVLQVLEHLNMYSRYYLPAIEKRVAGVPGSGSAWFVPGMLGDYFTRIMHPGNVHAVKNKMKAPKGYRPQPVLDAGAVLTEFIEHQRHLLRLLEQALKHDLGRIRVPITLSPLIRLKLGDTFRFLIAHQQRHMVQARNAIKSLGVATSHFPMVVAAQV